MASSETRACTSYSRSEFRKRKFWLTKFGNNISQSLSAISIISNMLYRHNRQKVVSVQLYYDCGACKIPLLCSRQVLQDYLCSTSKLSVGTSLVAWYYSIAHHWWLSAPDLALKNEQKWHSWTSQEGEKTPNAITTGKEYLYGEKSCCSMLLSYIVVLPGSDQPIQ